MTAALPLLVLSLFAAVAGGALLFDALAYRLAAVHRRRHLPSCPFDDETVTVPLPARLLAALASFVREWGATVLLLLTLPLPARWPRLRPPRSDGARRPVVLLHGYAQHPALLLWLARALRRDGWRCYLVRHRPLFGDIETSAARVATTIDRIRTASGAPAVDIVAHSMGGLIARACVRARGGGGVARLITLGTPHQGTEAFVGWTMDPMVAEMRPGSPLLVRLGGAGDPVPTLADCISIYSADDAIVLPSTNAYYPGAFNIEVRGLGHLSLLFSQRVYTLVRENLAAPLSAGGTPRAAGNDRSRPPV